MSLSPEPFESLTWALPLFSDAQWTASIRGSRLESTGTQGCFNRKTMRSHDGVRHWYEFFKSPTPDGTVTDAASLVSYGPGLMGFPGMMHGGALSTLVDEALAWGILCVEKHNGRLIWGRDSLEDNGEEEKEFDLSGWMATAWLNIKFLRVVPCPGVIGIKTKVKDLGKKMELSCIVRDGKGDALVEAKGLWVRVRGSSKL